MQHLYKYIEYAMATKISIDYIDSIININNNYFDIYYIHQIKKLVYKYNLLHDKVIIFDKDRRKMIKKSINYIKYKERKINDGLENKYKKRKFDDFIYNEWKKINGFDL